jgi:tetratricopeptide (TPR) repeat protein
VILVLAAVARAGALDEAKEEFAAGRFEAAMEKAGTVAERDADFARARYLVGEIALMLGDAKGARDAFRAASKAKPGAEPILTGLGRALLATEEYEEAVAVLRKAVEAEPKSGRAHCFLGIALRNETSGSKGASEIRKGTKLAADDPVVARATVLYWLEEGDASKAVKAADVFRKKRKKHPMGYFLKALALERDKEYDDAIEAYEQAIALDETFLDAHKNLAILCIAQNPLYTNKKRTELAMKHFTRYRELGGKDARVIQIHETLKQFLASRR